LGHDVDAGDVEAGHVVAHRRATCSTEQVEQLGPGAQLSDAPQVLNDLGSALTVVSTEVAFVDGGEQSVEGFQTVSSLITLGLEQGSFAAQVGHDLCCGALVHRAARTIRIQIGTMISRPM
jgi:hypothetical protein